MVSRLWPRREPAQPATPDMRTVLVLLASAAVVLGAADASAQSPGPGGAGPSQSTGNVSNANQSSSSQFLSGSNTGVNNGSLEIYSGADPYQGIVIQSSPTLPQ